MRIYIEGTLSTPQECFLPCDLFFANENVEENDTPSKDCVMLTGMWCESAIDGTNFSCRWKGVAMEDDVDYGEDFTKQDFLDRVKERNLTLANMSANFDTNVDVKVTSIMILDGEWGTETYLDQSLLGDEPIQFIA